MRITRRSLGVALRRWWGELLFGAAWVALLLLSQYTARTPQLFAGSLILCAVLGGLHYLEGLKTVAREAERDIAAEVAMLVSVPRDTTPREAERFQQFQAHVARAIRGHGAHLREARHG